VRAFMRYVVGKDNMWTTSGEWMSVRMRDNMAEVLLRDEGSRRCSRGAGI